MLSAQKKPHLVRTRLMSQTILWAGISWSHTGIHSGMTPLSREIDVIMPGLIQRVELKQRKSPLFTRLAGRMRWLLRLPRPAPDWIMFEKENPFYGENFWMLERQINEVVAQLSPFAVMLESIDEQLFLLAKEKARWPGTRLVGVSHQPPAWWRLNHARPDIVSALDLLVVVASTVRPYWEQFLDKKRIRVIPHGVDVEFFFPSESERKLLSGDENLRVIFCGQWLRDFETMQAVVAIADQLNLPLHFEMVVPRQSRGNEACYRMAMSHRVRWHSDLTDEDLRSVYRHSDLLLLPLRDSTANNGLLEGMACGLPVIVTDVGGVRDYAKENFADFVLPGDASGIIKILQGYLNQRDKLAARGRAARAYAEDHHSWRKIASEYIAALQSLD